MNAKLTTDKQNENVDNMMITHNNLKQKRQTTIYRRRRKRNRSSMDISDEEADEDEDDDVEPDTGVGSETDEFDENDEELSSNNHNNNNNESNEATERDNRDRLDDNTDFRLPFWDTYDSINQLYLQIGKYTLYGAMFIWKYNLWMLKIIIIINNVSRFYSYFMVIIIPNM